MCSANDSISAVSTSQLGLSVKSQLDSSQRSTRKSTYVGRSRLEHETNSSFDGAVVPTQRVLPVPRTDH